MAFVRRKNVRGYTYYQLVRNYREGGKHRQEVLEHLGPHDSLEAAILAEERKVASELPHYQAQITYWLDAAKTVLRTAKSLPGHEVEILDPDEAFSREQVLEDQYEEIRRSGDSVEAWDRVYSSREAQLILLSVRYHEAKEEAAYYEKCTSDCHARLGRLLRLMNEYPQPIRSSRTFDLLRRKEAQTL